MRIKNLSALVLTFVFCVLTLVGCSDETPENMAIYYDITFNSAGGSAVESVRVLEGSLISEPAAPQKEGYIFDGWKNGAEDWDFSSDKVTSALTLTASWINAKNIFEYESNGGKITLTGYKGNLPSITVPAYIDGLPVTALGDRLFAETALDNTYEIIVGENVVSIGESAFNGCSDIEIKIEGKLEYIGEKAFVGCNGLESIELGSGAVSVPFEAFVNCSSLTAVILSDSVTEIGENAFEGCTALETLTAHPSLKKISDSAFLDCDAFVAVYYYGDADEWSATEISEGNNGNDSVIGAKLYIYSEEEPTDSEYEYWYFDRNRKVRIW